MNFYDPAKSYKDNGVTSRQLAELAVDQNEYMNMCSGGDFDISMCVVLPVSAVKKLLMEMPDIFSDIEPQNIEDMNAEELELHNKMLADMLDPESHAAKFAQWVESKRRE